MLYWVGGSIPSIPSGARPERRTSSSAMGFPQTRLTLIQRLAAGGSEEDWSRFLADYWSPVCRFALRYGARDLNDAEEVASQTFEVLWRNRLLVAWMSRQTARLRSLLCAVARNVLANRHRVAANRQRIWREILRDHIREAAEMSETKADPFFAVWAEGILQAAVERLATEYYGEGKGDYLRVLYGRLCQGLTIAQVAEALELAPATVDNYYRHARGRLADTLEKVVRQQVEQYSVAEQCEGEFHHEWQLLGEYLTRHGGLELALRRAYEYLDPARSSSSAEAFTRVTERLRTPAGSELPTPPRAGGSGGTPCPPESGPGTDK